MEDRHLLGEDGDSGQLGDWGCQQGLFEQIHEEDGWRKQEEPHALQGIHRLQLGISAEFWKLDCTVKENGLHGWHAHDPSFAPKILALVKSYAGKREEAKDLIDDEFNREKAQGDGGPQDPEERKLAEDKKQDFVEEEIPEPQPRLLHARSTPRSTAQKTVSQEHEKGDGKKMKMTVEKPTHSLEASTPEPKRLRQQDEPNTERRVEITQVGEDSYYHMDYIIGEEEMAVWNYENEEEEVTALEIPDALWSNAPLDRVPPDPPKWIDDLADSIVPPVRPARPGIHVDTPLVLKGLLGGSGVGPSGVPQSIRARPGYGQGGNRRRFKL